jgi:hypothetical protein
MITKVIIYIILILSPLNVLARSEITGYISTDPSRPGEDINQDDDSNDSPETTVPAQPNGGSSLVFLNNKEKKSELISEEEIVNSNIENPIVLGFDRLPENTLVRDESGRVYIIKGERKIVIWDLVELWQYRGEPILDLPDSELSTYPTRRFFDNKLIRENNNDKIFVIRNGRKQPVKSLQELADKFFGQKIYNVGKEEFVLYLI